MLAVLVGQWWNGHYRGCMTATDYDSCATRYGKGRRPSERLIRKLLARVRVGSQSCVLDIGCGTGDYSVLVFRWTGAKVLGIDPSRGMLAKARVKGWDQVRFLQGRAEELPFRDQRFDLLFSIDVVHHVGDRLRMFTEAFRVLKVAAVVCTVTESREQLCRRFMARYFPSIVALNLARFSEVSKLVNWMRSSGFRDVETEAFVSCEAVTAHYVNAVRLKEYSVLELVPDEEFRSGLRRLKEDLGQRRLIREDWHTLIWGSR